MIGSPVLCRLLLAAGCADNAARLYLRKPQGVCTCVCKLRGHTDWVTSVSLRSAGGVPGCVLVTYGGCLLCSASHAHAGYATSTSAARHAQHHMCTLATHHAQNCSWYHVCCLMSSVASHLALTAAAAGQRLLLATGSQDKHVRIWSIRTAAAAAARPAAKAPGALSFARCSTQAPATFEHLHISGRSVWQLVCVRSLPGGLVHAAAAAQIEL